MARRVTKGQADHLVGRLSGVLEGDTVLEAAEKVLETMRASGANARELALAERAIEKYKAKQRSMH